MNIYLLIILSLLKVLFTYLSILCIYEFLNSLQDKIESLETKEAIIHSIIITITIYLWYYV